MPKIESQNEIASHQAKGFFVPSVGEFTLYVLLSMILLVGLNVGSIISRLSNNYIGNPEHLKTNFSTLISGFNSSFDSALGGRLGQILLWAFVGALAYIGLWLAKNVLNSFENDIIADHYLHPSSYSRIGYWSSSFSVKTFLVAMLLVTAGYLFILISVVMPAVAALAGSAAYNFHASTSTFYILFSIVGLALVLYIGVVLLKLVAHLWKLL
jgi:hypothetical protein